MPNKLWWRLASEPNTVHEVVGENTFTGSWAIVKDLQPNTDYETSTVSATGPWTSVRTKPAEVIPADRVPVTKKTHGGRPNSTPLSYYTSAQAEFLDPVAHPHIMGITIRTVKSGRYSDPTVWNLGRIPTTGDVVAVSEGHILIGDKNDDIILKDMLVEFGGTFRLATDTDTKWRLDTFMSMGNLSLVDKTPSTTPGKIKHQFIWHIQQAPGTTTRGGLMAMGPTLIHGAKKKSHLRVGLSSDQVAANENIPAVKAGATRVYLPGLAQSGWRVGQYIMIGGTQFVALATSDPQYKGPPTYNNPGKGTTKAMNRFQFGQEEQRILTAIEGDWAVFAEPLVYDHVGMRNTLASGKVVVVPPIVGNPSHNIEMRSASAAEDGTLDPTADLTDLQKRGHSMFMRCFADVRYVSTKNMARTDTNPTLWVDGLPMDSATNTGGAKPLLDVANGTPIANPLNVRGRYSLHFHGTGRGPHLASDITYLIGASAWAPIDAPPVPGWAITHHISRMGIEDCFAFNVRGAGMVSELGNELGYWANNLSMWCRGDGEGNEWGDRHETHNNHNESSGVGFGNQSRAIQMHGNISVSCRYGYLYHAQKSDHLRRAVRDIDLVFQDGIQKGTTQGYVALDETVSHTRVQIPPFIDNEAHACSVGFSVIHRLSVTDWARDNTPMLMEGFHCLNVPRPWDIPQYSNSYYMKDCLWQAPAFGQGHTGAVLGSVSYGWNFSNMHLVNYNTLFSGDGMNYDGHFVDITYEPAEANFSNVSTYNRTGVTLETRWGVMGNATKISDDSGQLRFANVNSADLPTPYPLAPYGYSGVLPSGYNPVPVGGEPYFILGANGDPSTVNTTLTAGNGRNTGSLQGMVVDSTGVHKWPDGQSSESLLANMSVKGPMNLAKIQPEQLVQRWGCWDDNGVWKVRAWFPIADRATHVKTHFYIDFTINSLDPAFAAVHDLGGPSPKPSWHEKLEFAPAEQPPLMPVIRTVQLLSPTQIYAVGGYTLNHTLLADDPNVRFTIVGGADAALFRISGRTLQWANNGTQPIGPAKSVTVRVTDAWGNTTDAVHTVSIASSERYVGEIVDDFNRADEALSVKHPKAMALAGDIATWGIQTNVLAFLGGTGSQLVSLGSIGASDQEISVNLKSDNGLVAFVFRMVDKDNYMSLRRIEGSTVAVLLYMTVAGVTTEVGRVATIRNNVTIKVIGRKVVIIDAGTSTVEPFVRYPKGGYKLLLPYESGIDWEPGAMLLPENTPMGTEVGFLAMTTAAVTSAIDNLTAKPVNNAVGVVA